VPTLQASTREHLLPLCYKTEMKSAKAWQLFKYAFQFFASRQSASHSSRAEAMTEGPRQTTPRPILSSISAQLFVANSKSSCDFYTTSLASRSNSSMAIRHITARSSATTHDSP